MSIFGDYKAYKKYEPAYDAWKYKRDVVEAKRLEYLKHNPQEINQEDIQRGKTLLRAIDIMDEYSQKRAQNMELATNSTLGLALITAVSGLYAVTIFGLKNTKFGQKFTQNIAKKFKLSPQNITLYFPMIVSTLAGPILSFPVQAMAAKAQVAASRRGRFEAMRNDLNSANSFALLTENQTKKANEISKTLPLENEKKNLINKTYTKLKDLKNMAIDSPEYKAQRAQFEAELIEAEKHINDSMTNEEIEKAKKDQQILTKLVEKIDISSQDYAENIELGIGIISTALLGISAFLGYVTNKVLSALKVKSAGKIAGITMAVPALISTGFSLMGTMLSKEASRVGRFKVKQELAKNPEQLVYVSDEKIKNIKDFQVKNQKKNIFKFLTEAYKNQKEYNKYKKTIGLEEKRFNKAVETLELTPKQLKDAKQLQKNTFRTFNKVDEKSQRYAESIEALGESANQIVSATVSFLGVGLIAWIMSKTKASANKYSGQINAISSYLVATIPAMLFQAYVTKEQKKASRVADMLAINEMQDYRQFR